MARATEVELKFIADIGDLQKRLAEVPDIGADSAKKLVKELTSQYKKAKSASDKLARDLKDSGEKMGKGLEGAKNAAEGLGGALGGTAGQVEKMLQATVRLGAGLGPIGAAVGAGTVGFGLYAGAAVKVASSLVSWTEAADELIERQTELDKVLGPLPDDTIASVHAFADAMDGLREIADRVHVLIAGDFAQALNQGAFVAVKMGLAVSDVIERFNAGIPILRAVASLFGVGELTITAAALATKALDQATESYDDQATALLSTLRQEKQAEQNKEEARDRAKAATKQAKDEEKEYREEIQRLSQEFKEQEAARNTLTALVRQSALVEMTEQDKINAKYDERIEKIAELMLAAKDAELAKEAIDAAELARQRDLVTAQQAQLDSAVSIMEQLRAKAQEIYDQQRANFGETLAQVAQYTDVFASAISNWSQLFEQVHEDELDRITTQADARKSSFEAWKQSEKERINTLLQTGKISDAEHARLMAQYHEDRKTRRANLDGKLDDLSGAAAREFKGMRKAQRARIIAEGAAAVVAMTAQMAAFLGPAAPVAAAAVMAPVVAAQLDLVNKQTPPEFPMGGLVSERMGMSPERGSPDHVLVGVRPDELILSPSESARAAAPTQIVLQLDRRTIAEAIADVGGVGYLAVQPGRISGRATIYGRG